VILVIVAVTILMLLLESLADALRAATPLVLGIWGTRQLLVAPDVTGLTLVDVLLLADYVAIGLALTSWTLLSHRIRRLKEFTPESTDPVPEEPGNALSNWLGRRCLLDPAKLLRLWQE
jgi:hypothetical protein